MRAIVLDRDGLPALAEAPEPSGPGVLVEARACGLCGSDLEKIGRFPAGAVLGHEVEGVLVDGTRVTVAHRVACGECERCRAGHESTCEEFRRLRIEPGGFAERLRATHHLPLPDSVPDGAGVFVEPLACVLRGAALLPRGRVLVVGHGFIGRLFRSVLERRGDEVFAIDLDPRRAGRAPDGPVDAAVVCAPGGGDTALRSLEPGGTLLVFADAGLLPADPVYRNELTVRGSRSATLPCFREAIELLPSLELPPVTRLPLERFAEGLELYRSGEALKVVFEP